MSYKQLTLEQRYKICAYMQAGFSKIEIADAEQIKAYREGGNLAFDRLYRRYENLLFSFILRTVRERSLADDLFQQTWLKAVKGLQGYDEQGKFSMRNVLRTRSSSCSGV